MANPALVRQVKPGPLYGPGDMNSNMMALGTLPPSLTPRFNKSGTVEPTLGVKVTAVRAEHSFPLVWLIRMN